ncbi:uncharacterized protein [Dermacentor albipictus]|uniref:uncharacterized protein isoform X2 n=1 Tax=Dermacentor albipictus TaxID=60249 RepID=UPI0031FDF8B4
MMSEMSMSVVNREPENEKKEDRRVAFILICNCILCILMILLLLLVFTRFSSDDSDEEETPIPKYNSDSGGGGSRPTAPTTTSNTSGADSTGGDVITTTPSSTPLPMPTSATARSVSMAMSSQASSSTHVTPDSLSSAKTAKPATSMSTRGPRGYENRAFTLICVFEYLTRVLPRSAPQCTDYVYIRFFVYSTTEDEGPLVFEKKKQFDGTVKLYYDDTEDYWKRFLSYRILDNYVRNSKLQIPYSRWLLGMWGTTFTRLMSGLWNGDTFRNALRDTLRSHFSDRLKITDIDGFAVINSIFANDRGHGRSEAFGTAFRSGDNPILEPNWAYIHTAAIWPGGSMPADVVGISTSNSTDESNIILSRGGGNNVEYKAASPPNPIRPVASGVRGMLDILAEFPHWKQVLGHQKLCFSLTTSINYMRSSVDNIDFVSDIRLSEDVQRYHRIRFTTKDNRNRYPVEAKNTSYHFDNTTYTHFWHHIRNGDLLTLFAYDMNDTLQYKIDEMLKAHGDDKCVVFDDLGEDDEARSFIANRMTYHFGRLSMLQVVQAAMVKKYGGPFP